MSKIKAVLFDFDGTIANTDKAIIDTWQHVFRRVEGNERQEAEIYATFGEPLFQTMHTFFGERAEECINMYREHQAGIYLEAIALYPGMLQTIRKLKQAGYALAVVTSRLSSSTFLALDKYDLRECFDAIVTFDDTKKHKPDPEPALLALAQIGIDKEHAVMIGDSRYDMECGLNAGIKTILVGWSPTAEVAMQYSPDYIIHRAEELENLLEDIC